MTETPSPDRDELLRQWWDAFFLSEFKDADQLLNQLRELGVSDDELFAVAEQEIRKLPEEDVANIILETEVDSLEAFIESQQGHVREYLSGLFRRPKPLPEEKVILEATPERVARNRLYGLCFEVFNAAASQKASALMEIPYSSSQIEEIISRYLDTDPDLDFVMHGVTMRKFVHFLRTTYLPILKDLEHESDPEFN